MTQAAPAGWLTEQLAQKCLMCTQRANTVNRVQESLCKHPNWLPCTCSGCTSLQEATSISYDEYRKSKRETRWNCSNLISCHNKFPLDALCCCCVGCRWQEARFFNQFHFVKGKDGTKWSSSGEMMMFGLQVVLNMKLGEPEGVMECWWEEFRHWNRQKLSITELCWRAELGLCPKLNVVVVLFTFLC